MSTAVTPASAVSTAPTGTLAIHADRPVRVPLELPCFDAPSGSGSRLGRGGKLPVRPYVEFLKRLVVVRDALTVLAGVRAHDRRRERPRARPDGAATPDRIAARPYAEEFDVDTARRLGNFPQAFSHLALIEAAGQIILAERLDEVS